MSHITSADLISDAHWATEKGAKGMTSTPLRWGSLLLLATMLASGSAVASRQSVKSIGSTVTVGSATFPLPSPP